jgi:hypothetical protein
VVATSDGGATWDAEILPSSVTSIGDISCPSPSRCWAVGSTYSAGAILTWHGPR